MGAKEKAERKYWNRRLMDAAGVLPPRSDGQSAWIFPTDDEAERLLDAYDDAEEAGDPMKMLEALTGILRLVDDVDDKAAE